MAEHPRALSLALAADRKPPTMRLQRELRRPAMRLPFDDELLETRQARTPTADVRPKSRLRVPTKYRGRALEATTTHKQPRPAASSRGLSEDDEEPSIFGSSHSPAWTKMRASSPTASPLTSTDLSDDGDMFSPSLRSLSSLSQAASDDRFEMARRRKSNNNDDDDDDCTQRSASRLQQRVLLTPRRSMGRTTPATLSPASSPEPSPPLRTSVFRRPVAPPSPISRSTEKLLLARVHYLTEALVSANQYHKKTQEHLAWALQSMAPPDPPTHRRHPPQHDVGRLSALSDCVSALHADQCELKQTFQAHVAAFTNDFDRLRRLVTQQHDNALEQSSSVRSLQSQYAALLHERKMLHNTIQELRGNIRVYCRIRPVAGRLGVRVDSTEALTVKTDDVAETTFSVDRIFDQRASQRDVYCEIAPLVTSALDGYNVCILAYGQTGSGKTHTMLGDVRSAETSGISIRVFEQLFELNSSGATQVDLSVVEIYNEKLVDLLVPGQPKLDIHMDKKAGVSVPNRRWISMTSVRQCVQTMDRALRHRAVGANDLNDASSRSHCITSVRIRRQHASQTTESKMHLVDLAGSERLGTSNSHGDRRTEAQHINKSLSALRHVLLQLKNQDAYVSYRNSKLTMLLQDAIGGHAKTLLLLCVNPLATNALETKCSLVFGERANAVELGKAKQHVTRKPT
ncbi:hypothetical protein SPRG_01606 [Saprolegnia parasitica CBS 223.65]|uniref:Kinesin-like protein n=1 Tax=Saprolegnia parasitica (strain CBS 223.65) TaxID=695850 RepID=A0A067D4J6_SAPPC|nr:hypothetical protein SPRG_01606 [Saprolegnia parasitica CBS 223.65]KDO33636.1 hypothetical protein SPRG_01606 [Saprolegnia parasitica CBS 223.65]|eukprot:XP_012195364.1 hypothetical protein SPRG_01606 [Saprolegnia parasitica CBS 223.65]